MQRIMFSSSLVVCFRCGDIMRTYFSYFLAPSMWLLGLSGVFPNLTLIFSLVYFEKTTNIEIQDDLSLIRMKEWMYLCDG